MICQRHCPFCKTSAADHCRHLALAVEGRDFVRRCVELCHGEVQWRILCGQWHEKKRRNGHGALEQEDFMWLETAFCDKFLKHLTWFGGLDYEWRDGPRPEQGGFWILLWSKDPKRFWWELRDELERQTIERPPPVEPRPFL